MAQGFLTQQSDRSVPGALDESLANNTLYAAIHTSPAGGVGAWKITEIGCFIEGTWGSPEAQMAMYDLDGVGDLNDTVGTTGTDSELPLPDPEDWLGWTGLDITVDGSTDYGIAVWIFGGGSSLRDGANPGSSSIEYNTSPGTAWEWPNLAGDSTLRTRVPSTDSVFSNATKSTSSVRFRMR